MINEEQSQSRPALYFSQQLPSTYIKGSTNIFVARQVDHASEKRETSQRNNVVRHVEGFCILFRRLYARVGRWPADSLLHSCRLF